MITFNWKKILESSEYSPRECVRIFTMLTYKQIPKNTYDPIYKYSKINYSGWSFLVNPEELLYNGYKYSYKRISVYIGLAALRSLARYKLTRDTSLDLFHVPINLQQYMQQDRLLYIEDDKVQFLYEKSLKEIKNGVKV